LNFGTDETDAISAVHEWKWTVSPFFKL